MTDPIDLSAERYERLMLTIFFETLTVVAFIMFKERVTSDFKFAAFTVSIMILQLPFISFIQNDFLARRPTLLDKVFRWAIRLYIALLIIGILAVIFLLDWKSGLISILIGVLLLIVQKWGTIEKYFEKARKEQKKKSKK